MAHDPATARDYYYKADAEKQALDIHGRMREAYGLNASNSPVKSVTLTESTAAPTCVQELEVESTAAAPVASAFASAAEQQVTQGSQQSNDVKHLIMPALAAEASDSTAASTISMSDSN